MNLKNVLSAAKSKIKSHLAKNSQFYIVSVTFAVLIIFLSVAFVKIKINHGLYVFSDDGANYGKLVALNGNAKRASSKNSGISFYKFNEDQMELIENIYSKNSTASLVVRLKIKIPLKKIETLESLDSLPILFGFLSADDFSKKGKFLKDDFSKNAHLSVTADAKEILDVNYKTKTFDISFALPVDKTSGKLLNVPGFFVQSYLPCEIESACVAPAIIGYDKSTEIPFWGFSSNGGNLNFNSSSFDFTGCSLIFPVKISGENVPPVYNFVFSESEENQNFSVTFGGERLKLKRLLKTKINSLALQNPFSNMEVSSENVVSVLLKSGDKKIISESKSKITAPIKTDPGLVLYWPKENWRNPDFELFEWDRFPGILIFDTKNYAVQSKFFARLAFFTEKEGFKGRILTNEQLEGKHDYNAHDYSAESLSKFFNAFVNSRVVPNDEEILLLDILLENGVLESGDDGAYKAGNGAVISISREIPSYNRKPLLTHEGFHALFFIDEEFQNFVAAVYETIDRDTHDFLIDYFKSQPTLGYDTNDRFLMHTEFMSYILQQPVNKVAEYFLTRASWGTVMRFTPDLCQVMRETGAIGFEDAAIILDDYVRDRFNVECGDICLLGY